MPARSPELPDEFLKAKQKYGSTADHKVRDRRREKGIGPKENPAPEKARDEGRRREPSANMSMDRGKDEI